MGAIRKTEGREQRVYSYVQTGRCGYSKPMMFNLNLNKMTMETQVNILGKNF